MKKTSSLSRVIIGFLLCASSSISAMTNIIQVTTTSDSGPGSLRDAINTVNSAPTIPNVITFDALGSGVQTISLLSPLPAITASYTFIDGSTAASWSLGSPVIVLDGTSAGTGDCLTLSAVSNCLIRGLVITNWDGNGISIIDGGVGSNSNAIVGCFIGVDATGTTAQGNTNGISIVGSTSFSNNFNVIGISGEGNLISGNTGYGIVLATNVFDTTIEYNFIGVEANGSSALANGLGGISCTGSTTPVLTEQCARTQINFNIISGNGGPGLSLFANCFDFAANENKIGTDSTGFSPVGNTIGVFAQGMVPVDATKNGSVADNILISNVISGNSSHGIYFTINVNSNTVDVNAIGSNADGTVNIGNGGHGVYILGVTNAPCSGNYIGLPEGEGNYIRFNGSGTGPFYGILIDGDVTTPSLYNSITQNGISANQTDGVKLLNGSNHSQAAPSVVNAAINNDGVNVTIAVQAPAASGTYNLDVYFSTSDRSPLTEGEAWVGGFANVAPSATVANMFFLPGSFSGGWVSAIATNLNNPAGGVGDSSEYSSNVAAQLLPDNILPVMFQTTL